MRSRFLSPFGIAFGARSFRPTSRSASSIARNVGTGIGPQVLVDIGAAELQDDRTGGISSLEALDGVGAAPGMDRNHQIGRPAVVA